MRVTWSASRKSQKPGPRWLFIVPWVLGFAALAAAAWIVAAIVGGLALAAVPTARQGTPSRLLVISAAGRQRRRPAASRRWATLSLTHE
jgi:hypothetical protein